MVKVTPTMQTIKMRGITMATTMRPALTCEEDVSVVVCTGLAVVVWVNVDPATFVLLHTVHDVALSVF